MDIYTIIGLIILLFSVILHEIAHGSVAYMQGDPTAKMAGRLSLNPLRHLDPIGSVLLPLLLVLSQSPFVIGWAKPVPVNPSYFSDKRWGELKVGAAGVIVNFSIAVIFSLISRFVDLSPEFNTVIFMVAMYNFVLGFFNLIPLPPLDGSHILFSLLNDRFPGLRSNLERYGMFILFALIISGLSWISMASSYLFMLISGRSVFDILRFI